jgi:surface antigen
MTTATATKKAPRSQVQKVLDVFLKNFGREVTASYLTKFSHVERSNAMKAVHSLKKAGHTITTDRRVVNGRQVTYYRYDGRTTGTTATSEYATANATV